MSYDSWLEAPYTARANMELAWEAFEEQTGVDSSRDDAEFLLEMWMEEGAYAVQQWIADDDDDEEA